MFLFRVINFILIGCFLPALVAVPARAASEAVVYSFRGGTDGFGPLAGLINVGGTLYGTTWGGRYNKGTVFKMTPAGVKTVLHSFRGSPSDGYLPDAGLINVGGTLYGTTVGGGAYGGGTVFKVTPTGVYKVLHSFGRGKDGAGPVAGLINVGGTLYGTTSDGGAYGFGTVFKMTPAGVVTVLYSFKGGTDGLDPDAGLVNVGGAFYGTTAYGGAYTGPSQGYGGTVFKVTPTGVETILHSFGGDPSDGIQPEAGLINVGGTLYGTTYGGGAYNPSKGTVFKVTLGGVYKVLHSFGGAPSDGAHPFFARLINIAGTLYGTTSDGGAYDKGTVFKMTPAGVVTVLHSFRGYPSDGYLPSAGLLNVGGTLYGTTSKGGAYCNVTFCFGTVFKVTP